MSGQIVMAAAGAAVTTAGTILGKATEALIKVVIENPKATLAMVGAIGLTAVALNSKNTIKIKIEGRA